MATDDLVVLAAAGVAVVGVADRAGDHHAADHEAGAAHGREADARVAGRLAQRREVEVTLTAWRLRLLGNRDERFVACGGPAALQARCLHVLGAQDHEGLELSVGQDAVVVGICLAREGAHEQLSKEVLSVVYWPSVAEMAWMFVAIVSLKSVALGPMVKMP